MECTGESEKNTNQLQCKQTHINTHTIAIIDTPTKSILKIAAVCTILWVCVCFVCILKRIEFFVYPIDTINRLNHSGYENHKMSSHSCMRLSFVLLFMLSFVQYIFAQVSFFFIVGSIRSSLSRETFSVYPLHCIVAVHIVFFCLFHFILSFLFVSSLLSGNVFDYTVQCCCRQAILCIHACNACLLVHVVFSVFFCHRRRCRHHHHHRHHFEINIYKFYSIRLCAPRFTKHKNNFKKCITIWWWHDSNVFVSIRFSCKALQFQKWTYLNHGL